MYTSVIDTYRGNIIPETLTRIQSNIFSNEELIFENIEEENVSNSFLISDRIIEKEVLIDQLNSLLKSLEHIRSSAKKWEIEENVASPSNDVLNEAHQLIKSLAKENYYPNRITPSIEEGLCLEFSFSQFRLYLELYNDGETGYIIEDVNKKEIVENNDIVNKLLVDKIVMDIIQSIV